MTNKLMLRLLLLLAIISVITSCNSGERNMSKPEVSIAVVRFKDPAYTKNLIVWDIEGDERLVLMRGNKCEHSYWTTFPKRDRDGSLLGATDEVKFPERYRDPFWALPDGWYLIDWAWSNLASDAYPYLGNSILTEVTFENMYENGSCYFDRTLPHITKSKEELFETKRIYIGDLMAYIHPDGNYPSYQISLYDDQYEKDTVYTASNQYFFHQALWKIPVASNVNTCLCELDDQMDAYWAVLQSQLSVLINNGDLDKLKHFDTNSLYSK